MPTTFADILLPDAGRAAADRPGPAHPWRQALAACLAEGGWGVVVAAVAAYLHLALVLGPQISAGAQGLLPFDLRPGGYGVEDVHRFLAVLTPEAAALYRGPARLNNQVQELWRT